MSDRAIFKKKKILFIVHELIYAGTQFMLLISCEAIKNKYEIEVWSLFDGEFKKELEKLHIKCKIVPREKFLSGETIDIIPSFSLAVCLSIFTDAAFSQISKFIPTVFIVHESRPLYDYQVSQDTKYAIKNSHSIYVPSSIAGKCFKNVYDKDVQILHNSVTDCYNPRIHKLTKNNKINLLSLGYLLPLKNFELVINAINSLPDSYKNKFVFKFAGKNLNEQYLSYLKSILRDNSKYIGEITNNEIKYKVYSQSDLIIVPSRFESCSLVALEAAMMAKPLIVTNETGAKYIVNDKNGWIIDNDVKSLQNILIKIIDENINLQKMGRYSRIAYLKTSKPSIFKNNFRKIVNKHIAETAKYSNNSIFDVAAIKKCPLVSIIVPIYNTSKYLTRCVDSIINQTYKNIEIILIDDGSTDASSAICDEYKKKDKRIIVIHKQNSGLSSARNSGLDICHGEFISFIDSDDYVDSSFIEYLYTLLVSNKADMAVCSCCSATSKDNIICRFDDKVYNRASYLEATTSVACWNKLYKKKIFDNLRFPLGKIAEDSYIYPKIIYKCHLIVSSSKILYFYTTDNKNSISYSLSDGFLSECMHTRLKAINFFGKHKFGKQICNYWFNDIYNMFIWILTDRNRGFLSRMFLKLVFQYYALFILPYISKKNKIKTFLPRIYIFYKKKTKKVE